jgi:hypothetical protein
MIEVSNTAARASYSAPWPVEDMLQGNTGLTLATLAMGSAVGTTVHVRPMLLLMVSALETQSHADAQGFLNSALSQIIYGYSWLC